MSQQKWGVTFIVMVAAFVAVIAIAANAASKVIIDVSSATRYGQGHVFTEPTGHDGETCLVTLAETNEDQPSANPGNYLTLTTGDVYLVLDIETGRGGFSKTSVVGVVGPTATLTWHIGRVSSAGAAVSLECEPEVPPSTTTTIPIPSTTTPTEVSTTVTSTIPPTSVPSTTTTSTTVPESSSTTTTTVPTTPTTSTSSPPSPSPSITVPTSTVPETTPIPTGVPTGSGPPTTHSPMVAFWLLLAGVSTLISAGTWAYSRGGDDEDGS